MLLISSSRFDEHTTPPGHPERPERAQVFDAVAAAWRDKGVRVIDPRPATREELLRVHTAAHVLAMSETNGRAAMLDPDTYTSPETYEISLLAAGGAVQAMEHAVETGEPSFAFVRPPGHHAERDRAMGFCLFNNIAIAAASAVARGIERVAVVDIDVHHGNGTQWMFYDDRRVLYVSTHQYPFYPGTGGATEVGRGEAAGFTFNVPLEAGATDADYLVVYMTIAQVLEQFAPGLLLVSAGYDAHADDPLASMRVSTAGYGAIVRMLKQAAERVGCPLAAVTEGGYDLDALRACLDVSVDVLNGSAGQIGIGADLPPEGGRHRNEEGGSHTPRADRALALVRNAQSSYWRL
jgi:acetoin utilization deacetylase AcuC-like enzyme